MGTAPALRGAGKKAMVERKEWEIMPKMSMGERSRSWTVSTRRTPTRVVGFGAISRDDDGRTVWYEATFYHCEDMMEGALHMYQLQLPTVGVCFSFWRSPNSEHRRHGN